MANPTPEKPFGYPISVLKPNIPSCWPTVNVNASGGNSGGTQDVNIVNASVPVTVSGTPNVNVTNNPTVQISGTPTVTVSNTTSNPVPTQEVASGT